MAGLIVICFLVAILTGGSATAEDSPSENAAGPDKADLVHFLECSETARMHVLSLEEAANCLRTYMRIKLSFVPGVNLDDFESLSPSERAAVNLVGYRRYMEWRSRNAAAVEALATVPEWSSVLAED